MAKIKLFTYVLPMVIAVSICSVNSFAQSQKTEIPIYVKNNNNPTTIHHPKSPALIPIEAYYESNMSVIMLSFKRDLGVVEVEVFNQSTGEYLEGNIKANVGVSVLKISGNAGFYQIKFILTDSSEYVGEFEVTEM